MGFNSGFKGSTLTASKYTVGVYDVAAVWENATRVFLDAFYLLV